MKKGQLKIESVKILKQIATHIEESKYDYDSQDLKALMSEALAYYDLYLLKKSNKRIDAQKLEKIIVPKWEEGLRARIREYFDERQFMLQEIITFVYALIIFIGFILVRLILKIKDPNKDLINNINKIEDGKKTNLESKNTF